VADKADGIGSTKTAKAVTGCDPLAPGIAERHSLAPRLVFELPMLLSEKPVGNAVFVAITAKAPSTPKMAVGKY
jgi:hypothetical protein